MYKLACIATQPKPIHPPMRTVHISAKTIGSQFVNILQILCILIICWYRYQTQNNFDDYEQRHYVQKHWGTDTPSIIRGFPILHGLGYEYDSNCYTNMCVPNYCGLPFFLQETPAVDRLDDPQYHFPHIQQGTGRRTTVCMTNGGTPTKLTTCCGLDDVYRRKSTTPGEAHKVEFTLWFTLKRDSRPSCWYTCRVNVLLYSEMAKNPPKQPRDSKMSFLQSMVITHDAGSFSLYCANTPTLFINKKSERHTGNAHTCREIIIRIFNTLMYDMCIPVLCCPNLSLQEIWLDGGVCLHGGTPSGGGRTNQNLNTGAITTAMLRTIAKSWKSPIEAYRRVSPPPSKIFEVELLCGNVNFIGYYSTGSPVLTISVRLTNKPVTRRLYTQLINFYNNKRHPCRNGLCRLCLYERDIADSLRSHHNGAISSDVINPGNNIWFLREHTRVVNSIICCNMPTHRLDIFWPMYCCLSYSFQEHPPLVGDTGALYLPLVKRWISSEKSTDDAMHYDRIASRSTSQGPDDLGAVSRLTWEAVPKVECIIVYGSWAPYGNNTGNGELRYKHPQHVTGGHNFKVYNNSGSVGLHNYQSMCRVKKVSKDKASPYNNHIEDSDVYGTSYHYFTTLCLLFRLTVDPMLVEYFLYFMQMIDATATYEHGHPFGTSWLHLSHRCDAHSLYKKGTILCSSGLCTSLQEHISTMRIECGIACCKVFNGLTYRYHLSNFTPVGRQYNIMCKRLTWVHLCSRKTVRGSQYFILSNDLTYRCGYGDSIALTGYIYDKQLTNLWDIILRYFTFECRDSSSSRGHGVLKCYFTHPNRQRSKTTLLWYARLFTITFPNMNASGGMNRPVSERPRHLTFKNTCCWSSPKKDFKIHGPTINSICFIDARPTHTYHQNAFIAHSCLRPDFVMYCTLLDLNIETLNGKRP